METTNDRRTAGVLALATLVLMAALTACGGGETESPSTTTTTPSTAPNLTPTEKRIAPTGGNSFSPQVKAPPAPTAIPGNH